jgi:hypothetical protein
MARQYLPGPADAKKGASLLKPVAPGPLKQVDVFGNVISLNLGFEWKVDVGRRTRFR